MPFFQSISQSVRVGDVSLYEGELPKEIAEMVNARGSLGPTDSVNFSEYGKTESGVAQLIGRIKSHPDVGKRHYPARYREIFGDAEPAIGVYG
ncbi:hypothetical protein FRC02_008269 [Tulasnella sp. 418]|nr:hypothetical protein FRC02_008269 [Tulasnella sp. 418]